MNNKTVVADGVNIGIRLGNFCIRREYETPYNHGSVGLHTNQAQGQQQLAVGSAFQSRVMIPHVRTRKSLHTLLAGQTISWAESDEIQDWITEHRKSLLPYIKFKKSHVRVRTYERVSASAQKRSHRCLKCVFAHVYIRSSVFPDTVICTSQDGQQWASLDISDDLRKIWRHWASGAPELVFLPTPVFEAVSTLLSGGELTEQQRHQISVYSHGVHLLMLQDESHRGVSDSLKALLADSLRIAMRCLVAEVHVPSKEYSTSTKYSPFETMIREGVWAPSHPVTTLLPTYKADILNSIQNEKRRNIKQSERAQADKEATDLLVEQHKLRGVTCVKYKTRYRSLSPGLFTVFCLGCGICEAWEMMKCAESPATFFRMLAHRFWGQPVQTV